MRKVCSVILAMATMLVSSGAWSHHSFSAEFDVGRPVNITGAITEVEWTNPHAWLHLAVEDEQGKVQH